MNIDEKASVRLKILIIEPLIVFVQILLFPVIFMVHKVESFCKIQENNTYCYIKCHQDHVKRQIKTI